MYKRVVLKLFNSNQSKLEKIKLQKYKITIINSNYKIKIIYKK